MKLTTGGLDPGEQSIRTAQIVGTPERHALIHSTTFSKTTQESLSSEVGQCLERVRLNCRQNEARLNKKLDAPSNVRLGIENVAACRRQQGAIRNVEQISEGDFL